MRYLVDLVNDLIADPLDARPGHCRVHRATDQRCMACMVNSVEKWDAGLARLIYLLVCDGEESTGEILWDYLSDRGLEHHWQSVTTDCQLYRNQGGKLIEQ